MKHQRPLVLALAVCALVWLEASATANPTAADRPNFILFITDDIGWNDVGCYGSKVVKTPHLDRMATEARVFDRAYLMTSSCSPTRCSLITGRYPHNTGAPELHTRLPEGQFVFPAALKKAGYYTVLSGKHHMGPAVNPAFAGWDWPRRPCLLDPSRCSRAWWAC